MSPRSYRMNKRADAVEETRRKIVEATVALHTTKGIRETSWQDIAERADVAVGTVYYHFPTFEELIPACTSLGRQMARPPTVAIFENVRSRKRRLERLVAELFAFYERARGGIENSLRDRDQIPALKRFAEEQAAILRSLVEAALGVQSPKASIDLVTALLDFRVWVSLQERGIAKTQATRVMNHILACAINAAR